MWQEKYPGYNLPRDLVNRETGYSVGPISPTGMRVYTDRGKVLRGPKGAPRTFRTVEAAKRAADAVAEWHRAYVAYRDAAASTTPPGDPNND